MFQKHTGLAALLSASLAITGCAPGVHTALKPELREKVGSTEAYAGIKQSELYAQIIPSQAGAAAAGAVAGIPGIGILLAGVAGGIAGAADAGINASRAKEQEELMPPLRDSLADFNFDQRLTQQLDAALPAVTGLHAAPLQVVKQVEDKHYHQLFENSKAGAVLFLNTDYSLSPDFSALVVSTAGLLYAREPGLRKAAGKANTKEGMRLATQASEAIYRNSYVFEAKLPAASADKAQNIAAWLQDGRIRATLEHGVGEIVALIAMDLQASPVEPVKSAKKTQTYGKTEPLPEGMVMLNDVPVQLVAKTASGQRVRFENGTLKSLSEPVQQVATTAPATQPTAAVPAGASGSR